MQGLVGKSTIRDKRWKDPSKYLDNRKVSLRFHNLPYYDRTLSEVLNETFPSIYFDENMEKSRYRERSNRPLVIFSEGKTVSSDERRAVIHSHVELRNVTVPVLIVLVIQEKDMYQAIYPQNREYKDIRAEGSFSSTIVMIEGKKNSDEFPVMTNPHVIQFNLLFLVGFSQWLAGVTGAQEVEIARPRSILSDVIWRDDDRHLEYIKRSVREGNARGLEDSEIYKTLRYDPTLEERHERVFIFGKIFDNWVAGVKRRMALMEDFIEGGGISINTQALKKSAIMQPAPAVQPQESSFFEEMVPTSSSNSSFGASTPTSSSSSSSLSDSTSDALLSDDDLIQPEKTNLPVASPLPKKPSRSRAKPAQTSTPPPVSVFGHLLGKVPAQQSSGSTSQTFSEKDMDTPSSSLTLKRSELPASTEAEDGYMPQRQRVGDLIGEPIGTNQQKLGALMQQLTRVNMSDVQRGFKK